MTRSRRQERQETPLSDEPSERAVIGGILARPEMFWDYSDRLKPEHFWIIRLGRIWQAMQTIAAKGKEIKIASVAFHIVGDRDETTPLRQYLEILRYEVTAGDDALNIASAAETVLQLAGKRALIEALQRSIADVKTADVSTPVEEMLDSSVSSLTASITGQGDRYIKSYHEHGEKLIRDINEDRRRGDDGTLRGLSPGLRAVAEVLGPLLPGKVYVLAGLSSGGKTALASGIVEAAALDAKAKGMGPGYMASMEMSGRELAARSIAAELGLTSFKLERSEVNEYEFEQLATRGLEHLRRFPIQVDTKPRLTMEEIRTRMLRQKHRTGLSFGLIDHLLLLKRSAKVSMMDQIMDVMVEGKMLANELEIPLIMLSQVNEKLVMDRPSMEPIASDLFGSQAIQQNADVTAFIHRPEIVVRRKGPKSQSREDVANFETRLESLKGKAVIFNDKGRGHGSGIRRELIFDGPSVSFRDV